MSDVPTRLLREALRGSTATASSSGCVDADTLAAWADGTLSARERAAAESHASSCGRCQTLLAAMTRTTASAPVRQGWRAWRLGWLMPLAAAAAAMLLWISVPKMTRLEQSVALPAPARSTSQTSVSAPEPPAFAPSLRRDLPKASANLSTESKDAVTLQRQSMADEERTAALAPAEPAPRVADASPQIAARELAPDATRDPSSGAAPKSQAPARAMADAATSVARAEALARRVVVQTHVVSPNPNIRWRLLTGGSVERSIDGGTTWQTQSTGAPATLTAGVAPSPTTCWLVGPAGTVVLSVDGRTWQRVPIPETIDLASVSASDAANATVTAVDGRSFATLDGGRSWRAQ